MDENEVVKPQANEPVRQIAYAFHDLRRILNQHKPNDHSLDDRFYAVTLTELEKVYAYFVVHVGGYHA